MSNSVMQEVRVCLDTSKAPRFLSRVVLRYFPLPITRLSLAEALDGSHRFDAAITVRNTHNGEPMELHWAMFFPAKLTEKELLGHMYLTLHNMLAHELAESWLVDERRTDDPHGTLDAVSAYTPPPSVSGYDSEDANLILAQWERNRRAVPLNAVAGALPERGAP